MVDHELVKRLRVAAIGMLHALDLPGLGAGKTLSARMAAIATDITELDRVGVAESRLRAALEARPEPLPWRVPGRTTREKWHALASTFPSLSIDADVARFASEVDMWKQADLMISRIHTGMYGAGKGHAMTFVIGLFRHPEWPVFDVTAAMGQWDEHHRAAFAAWASDPWWP